MKRHPGPKKQVQKVKRKRMTGNEQYKSVVIGTPKVVINKSKLDELYEIVRLHAQAVNEWIDKWYWRLDIVEKILIGGATTVMQEESISTNLLAAYVQIAGNRMLDILRSHYLLVQDRLASDIWKVADRSLEYKLVYAGMARNHELFARFISGDFRMEDVVARRANSDNEYPRRVADACDALTHMERWSIPVRLFHAFRDIRWRWWIRSPERVPKWYRALSLTGASGRLFFFLRSVNGYHWSVSRDRVRRWCPELWQ